MLYYPGIHPSTTWYCGKFPVSQLGSQVCPVKPIAFQDILALRAHWTHGSWFVCTIYISIYLYSPIYLYASSLSLHIFINSKTIYNDSLYLNLLWILSACLCLQENQSVWGTEHSCNKGERNKADSEIRCVLSRRESRSLKPKSKGCTCW